MGDKMIHNRNSILKQYIKTIYKNKRKNINEH